MAATFTLSGDLATIVGANIDPKAVEVYVEASEPAITDTTAHVTRVGSVKATVNADGTWEAPGLLATNATDIVPAPVGGETFKYRVLIRYRDARTVTVKNLVTGWFDLTANTKFDAIDERELTTISAEFAENIIGDVQDAATAAIAQVASSTTAATSAASAASSSATAASTAKAAAEAARAGAEAVGTVADTQIAGRINASGSATDTALKTFLAGQVVTPGQTVADRLAAAYAQVRDPASTESAIAAKPVWTRRGVVADLSYVSSPFDSIYWPWVIKMAGKVTSPLGAYYLYYSTDHQNGPGGVGVMTAPTPLGPWTDHGQVYVDTVAGRQTETPSILWLPWVDPAKPFFMYYQQDWNGSIPSGVIGAQSTLLAQSADGLTWTRYDRLTNGTAASAVVLDAYSASAQTGNAHSGYFMPAVVGRQVQGPSLFGGGDYPGFAYWHSRDGKTFERNSRKLGYNTDKTQHLGARLTSWNHSTVLDFHGELWWVGILTNFSSGEVPKDSRIAQARIAPDRMTLLSEPEVIIDGTGPSESVNIRSLTLYCEAGVAYLNYQCDNKFFTATAGGV